MRISFKIDSSNTEKIKSMQVNPNNNNAGIKKTIRKKLIKQKNNISIISMTIMKQ